MKRFILIIATTFISTSVICSPKDIDYQDYTDLVFQLQFLSARSKAKILDEGYETPYYTWLADFYGNAGQSPETDSLRYLIIRKDDQAAGEAIRELATGVYLLFNTIDNSKAFIPLNNAIKLAAATGEKHIVKLSYFAILELYKQEVTLVSEGYARYLEEYGKLASSSYELAWYHLHKFRYVTKKVDMVSARKEIPALAVELEDFFDANVFNERLMALYYSNLALLYSLKKEHRNAAAYYEKTIDFGKTEDFLRSEVFSSYLHLAESYSNLREFDRARTALREAKNFWNKSDIQRSEFLQKLFSSAYYFEKINDYDSAFFLLKDAMELDRAMEYRRNSLRISELKVDLDLAEIENENLLKDRELEEQKYLLLISLAVLFVFVAFIFVLFKANKKIRSKNNELKDANEQIVVKNLKIETLMKELHHRVKNNLQIISSLLGLQSMKLKDESAKKAVSEGKERIRAMSLIHQRLYQNELVTSLNIRDYITDLLDDISKSYCPEMNVRLKIKVPSIEMDADTAMPIGLIINELATNSFKYAFDPSNPDPALHLSLENIDNEFYRLMVKDNGKGLSDEIECKQKSTFGMKLVTLLVNKQLKGSLEITNNEGLIYTITFPVNKIIAHEKDQGTDSRR